MLEPNSLIINLNDNVSPAKLATIFGCNVSLLYQHSQMGRLPPVIIDSTYLTCIQQYLEYYKKSTEVKLVKEENEQKLRLSAEAHPDSINFDRAVYEATQMPLLITDSQYSQLLELRFQVGSYKTAQACWQQLTSLGLSTGMNKDTTISALMTYYLKRSSISTKYANDAERKADLILKLDLAMPTALAQLKYALKGGTGKPSSGVYVW